jgi:hypothetical protein
MEVGDWQWRSEPGVSCGSRCRGGLLSGQVKAIGCCSEVGGGREGAPWWSTTTKMWGNDGAGTNTTLNFNKASKDQIYEVTIINDQYQFKHP